MAGDNFLRHDNILNQVYDRDTQTIKTSGGTSSGSAGGSTSENQEILIEETQLGNAQAASGSATSIENQELLIEELQFANANISSGSIAPLQIANYFSPSDGNVSYASNVSLTCSVFPFTVADSICFIPYIYYKPTGGSWVMLYNGINGVSFSASANVITVTGAGTPFITTDDYFVGIRYTTKAYDANLNAQKVTPQNNVPNPGSDAITIVEGADVGASDDTWVDQGSEVYWQNSVNGVIWIIYTANDSLLPEFQILAKHESGGADEFVAKDADIYQSDIVAGKVWYGFTFNKTIPYIQIQTKAATVGTTEGTVTILLTKSN